jgi:hypothetical protein
MITRHGLGLSFFINAEHNHGEEVLHEGWSSYDNLLMSSCDNCHGVRQKTSVYLTKTLVNICISS